MSLWRAPLERLGNLLDERWSSEREMPSEDDLHHLLAQAFGETGGRPRRSDFFFDVGDVGLSGVVLAAHEDHDGPTAVYVRSTHRGMLERLWEWRVYLGPAAL